MVEKNTSKNGFVSFLGGFFIGSATGAVIALLTTPHSGSETREQIRTKGLQIQNTAEHTANDILETVKTATDDMNRRSEELQAQRKIAMKETQEQWAEAVKEIKQVAHDAILDMKTTVIEDVDTPNKAATETN